MIAIPRNSGAFVLLDFQHLFKTGQVICSEKPPYYDC